MGALHEGHVTLFRAARATCDLVVASLFVNPTQFGDPADLVGLPARRGARCSDGGARPASTVCSCRAVDEMYPEGFATWVDVDGPAQGLEGDHRPGHFRGVATVCLKLFTIVAPHVACVRTEGCAAGGGDQAPRAAT